MSHPWLKRLPKLRLTHQLMGFFAVVVLFPLLLLSFSIYSINQKAVKKQVNQFTEHTAEATYESLRLEMGWQQEQARLAGQYWQTLLDTHTPEWEKQRRIRDFFRTYDDFQAVAFYSPAGTRLAAYSRPQPKPEMPLLPAHLGLFGTQVRFQVAHTPSSTATKKGLRYSLQVVVPGRWVSRSGKVGAVVFLKTFPYLDNLMSERAEALNHGFVIADEAGTILAGPAALVSKNVSPEDQVLLHKLEPGNIHEFSTRTAHYGLRFPGEDPQETPEIEKVLIKMPHLGWSLILESPYQVQRHFILTARTQSVALVFLCIGLIIILGSLYSRGINQNFRQLIKGIKALGEGNYSRKIRLITKSWTPYEIVYLTAEFNRMANKISSAWSSIQQLNQELIDKNQQDLFIAQATQRLHSRMDPDLVCQTATTLLVERPDFWGALLYLKAPEGGYTLASQTFQNTHSHRATGSLLTEDVGILNQCLYQKRAFSIAQERVAFLPEGGHAKLHPVFYQETPLGVLMLIKPAETPASSAHHASDTLMIELLCSQIGIALNQARQWQELQLANFQLAKLDEMKSNLIDTVSHELRTPLTNIKGYTSRLIRNDSTLDGETKIKSLKVIKQQADRLGRMVEDLLVIPDLERAEGIRVFPDRVDLHELIQRSVAFVQEKARREIRVIEAPETWDILVDPDRMEQVILNLLDNALKYSLEDAVIEISTRFHPAQGTAAVEVFNPCEPIAPSELAQLFTKFKRLDERLTRTTRGTGLGLFITKGLVEAMSGTISLDGAYGFRVIVEIPLYQDNTPTTPRTQPLREQRDVPTPTA